MQEIKNGIDRTHLNLESTFSVAFIKGSLLMVQAKAAEGKSPQRLFSLNREEPSRRKVAVSK